MILEKNVNTFNDAELLLIYDRLHSIRKGFILINFLLKCDVDENENHYWIGNTQELARLLGNKKGDNLASANFRRYVIQPLLDKGIVLKQLIKRKTVKYILSSNWKSAIFA